MASVRLCNAMTRRYIIALFQRLIKKAQKQIGIVSFKIAQDENGADVSRHCALAQLTVAANISLSRDKEYKSLDPKKSYEQLMRQIVLVQEHRQMLTERIDRYLRSKEARLISWLIKSLPKGNLSPQSSGTPR